MNRCRSLSSNSHTSSLSPTQTLFVFSSFSFSLPLLFPKPSTLSLLLLRATHSYPGQGASEGALLNSMHPSCRCLSSAVARGLLTRCTHSWGVIHQRTANVGAGAGPGSVHPAGPPARRDIRAEDVSKCCLFGQVRAGTSGRGARNLEVWILFLFQEKLKVGGGGRQSGATGNIP